MPLQIEIKEVPQLSPEKDMEPCVLSYYTTQPYSSPVSVPFSSHDVFLTIHPAKTSIQDLGNSCPGALLMVKALLIFKVQKPSFTLWSARRGVG